MNKNKKIVDLTGYKHKNTFDGKNMTSNYHPIPPDKKTSLDISIHNKQNKIKDNDFKDITNIVRNSVEKINNLFNQTEFQNKKFLHKTSKELNFEINDIDEYDELNKSNEIKKKERSNTLEKSSKANFTFNINNFINVPNINTTMPNISEIRKEKNIDNNNNKANLRGSMNTKKNQMYLNNINNKKNMLLEHKGISNKKLNILYDNNHNYSSINDSLFQIDEIQTNSINKIKTNINPKVMSINNQKNNKINILNSRASKTNSKANMNKINELSKSIKEVKESGTSTPLHNDNNINMTYSGLTTINQNRKVLYKMPINKKKEKENSNLNTAQKTKYHNQIMNRPNKYKINQNQNTNNQNKANIKRNNDLYKYKQIKNNQIMSQSKKLFKTGENFYPIKKDKEKSNEDINKNENVFFEEKNKKENNYKPSKNNINITVKTMDEINDNIKYENDINNTINDRFSSTNSPIDKNYESNKRRGSSIPPFQRKTNEMFNMDSSRHSSSRLFHQVVNIFYSKEFPNTVNTNEILKLMLFFNEYLINNNLLNDYNNKENKKLLNDYSKYISSKIKVDFPQEHDIVVDPSIKCVKKIQRKWRKRKIEKYLQKNKKSEVSELKHMIVNKYIKRSGYKIKKILGLFNTIVENFENINKQPDINELFYQIQKLIHNKLTDYEKNLLYKEFINSVIFNKNN